MVESMEVDNTKAIALPILFIIALLLAAFITRQSLGTAFTRAKSELRFGILFFGGALCTILSVFLFPTAAWPYGIVSALFAYMFSLVCAPGMIEKHAGRLFLGTAAWFAILLGIPSRWSSGILATVTQCKTWFPTKTGMCEAQWITYVTIICIAVIIINFFALLVLMSFAFDVASGKTAAPVPVPANKGQGEYAQPLNSDAHRAE